MAVGKLKIKNFQAQESLEIDLGKVTVITGPSDRGKSSCIRALNWLLYNDAPRDCVTWGKDCCSVSLEVDGHVIERRRDKKNNLYILDGKQFACLRGGVPPEIQAILSVVPDNIQKQHDSVFWFSETAGEVAKRLNSVVNLDIIDRVFGVVSSRIRKSDTELEVLEGFVAKYQSEVDLMSGLPRLEQMAAKLQEIERAKEAKQAEYLKLEPVVWKLRRLGFVIPLAESSSELSDSWLEDNCEWRNISDSVQKISAALIRLKKIVYLLAIPLPDCGEVEENFNEFDRLKEKMVKLANSIESITAKKVTVYKLEADLRKEEKNFLEKLNGRCPVCGNIIDGSMVCP